jgi:branched-chain amino acid transport system ATP-binding protein
VCRLGIAKTFQIPQLFPSMSVADNVLVAALYGHGATLPDARRQAQDWLAFVGLADKARVSAETLSVGERRRADLARVLATGAPLILLDENMAGLNRTEVEAAVTLLRRVRERGRTLVVTEHIMRAIVGLADRVVVLNHGEKIAEGRPDDVMRDATVVKAYLGHAHG